MCLLVDGVNDIEYTLKCDSLRVESENYLKSCGVRMALYYTKQFKEYKICVYCWIDELCKYGYQEKLRKLWLPLHLMQKINTYDENHYLLVTALQNVYKDSVVEEYVLNYVNGIYSLGYLFNKLEKYKETAKLVKLFELLPKSIQCKLNRRKYKILYEENCVECFGSSVYFKRLVMERSLP